MSRYARVLKKLEELRLNSLKDNLDEYIEFINKGKKDVLESLDELLELEIRKIFQIMNLNISRQ